MKFCKMLMCLLLSVSVAAYAAEESTTRDIPNLPAYYPKSFDNRGLIYALGSVDGEPAITVDGNRYPLMSGAPIHFLSQRYGPVSKLEVGMGIGFRTINVGGSLRIAEVWELPAALTPEPS